MKTQVIPYQFSSKLNKKLFPLERNLNNFSPAKSIHFDSILEHHQTDRSYTQVYLAVGRVLKKRERYEILGLGTT